jgi:hypothetical protein
LSYVDGAPLVIVVIEADFIRAASVVKEPPEGELKEPVERLPGIRKLV